MVLLVRSAIFRSVFWNGFVMESRFFSNVGKAGPSLLGFGGMLSVMGEVSLGVRFEGLQGWTWKPLLCRMLQMVSSSSMYSCPCRLCVLSLL